METPMNKEESGVTSNSAPSGGDGQGHPLKPYHRPVLKIHGSLRELTQGVASGNGDGASFGKKPHPFPKR
jgi:hypothetical protein